MIFFWIDFIQAFVKILDSLSLPLMPIIEGIVFGLATIAVLHVLMVSYFNKEKSL